MASDGESRVSKKANFEMQRAGKENPAIQGSHNMNEPSTAQTTKQNPPSRRAKYLMIFLFVVVFVTAVISLAWSLDHRKSSPSMLLWIDSNWLCISYSAEINQLVLSLLQTKQVLSRDV